MWLPERGGARATPPIGGKGLLGVDRVPKVPEIFKISPFYPLTNLILTDNVERTDVTEGNLFALLGYSALTLIPVSFLLPTSLFIARSLML